MSRSSSGASGPAAVSVPSAVVTPPTLPGLLIPKRLGGPGSARRAPRGRRSRRARRGDDREDHGERPPGNGELRFSQLGCFACRRRCSPRGSGRARCPPGASQRDEPRTPSGRQPAPSPAGSRTSWARRPAAQYGHCTSANSTSVTGASGRPRAVPLCGIPCKSVVSTLACWTGAAVSSAFAPTRLAPIKPAAIRAATPATEM